MFGNFWLQHFDVKVSPDQLTGASAGGPSDGAERGGSEYSCFCHENAPTRDAWSGIPCYVRPTLATIRLAALLLPKSSELGGRMRSLGMRVVCRLARRPNSQ